MNYSNCASCNPTNPMNMTVEDFEIRTYLQKWPTQFTLSVCIVMTFLLPYNVRCDALHLNCSIMISWNSLVLHYTRAPLGDKVEKISLCITLHKSLLHSISFGLQFSVWLQFKSYVNVRRSRRGCNTSFTTDRSNNYKCTY